MDAHLNPNAVEESGDGLMVPSSSLKAQHDFHVPLDGLL